jgi:hypothetical protein
MGRPRRLTALNDEILSEIVGRFFAGEIRNGLPYDGVGGLMPPLLRAFRRVHPNVLGTLGSDFIDHP